MHLALKSQGGPLSVLQITDTHLGASEGNQLAGITTQQSLDSVLDIAAKETPPDLILLTGDLSDDGSDAAYQRLADRMATTGIPHAWLPGNHDNLEAMSRVWPGQYFQTIGAGEWGLILLNSQIPGAVGGALEQSELDRLQAFLDDPQYSYILVCVHHHPVLIGCDWLDEQRISNADELFALLDVNPKVRGVMWGHVHQEYDDWRGHMRLLGSPSTCVQFAPNQRDFKVDELGPGCRWLWLGEDGSLETRVDRVDVAAFEVDYDCAGY